MPQDALADLKEIVAKLSKLKNELQTNKPIRLLSDGGIDEKLWNEFLQNDRQIQQDADGAEPAWFQSAWLYVECYFYRRIVSTIKLR